MAPAKKRRVRDNEDSNGRENKEEKVVVGRYTFNRYLKTQAEERNIKIDNEFRKAIALKWHTLDPTEKAKFFVPSAHASNATPKANEDLSKCSATLLTRCSPQRFHDIVSRFSEDQINAIKEMGFGTLVQYCCDFLCTKNISKSFSLQANEPQVGIKNIKKEISSPELSPDPLLEYGDKIERLTAQLLHEKPRKIQDIGPFKGCRDLSNEEVDLIAFIYLEVWNEDFVVFETKNETLDRKEIRCLEPGALVSNLVVNAALSTIRKPESSTWFCTTYFSVRAIQAVEEGGDALSEFGSTARKRFAPIFGEAKLMDCDMIFIPILDSGTEPKHWFLMVVNIPSTEVEIWDTYPSTRTEARTNLVHRLMWAFNAIFEAEINVSFTKKWSFCSFRVRHPYHVPKQHNSFDCGIYMIKFMLDYENAYQIGDEFDSVNERVQLALRLLKHPNNLALSEIEKGMQSEESSTKVMQPEESEESRGTSVNRNTKTLQQLDETLQNHANGNNDKRKVIKKESKLQKELPFQPAKRGRGRPLGSKNKSKKAK